MSAAEVFPGKGLFSTEDPKICRICLSEQEMPDHELISPCKCAGSMRYIGLSCLKEWLDGKRRVSETKWINSYIWKNLECEICKTSLKGLLKGSGGRDLSLLNYSVHQNSQNYMILESTTENRNKVIYVVNFDEHTTVKVGRAQ